MKTIGAIIAGFFAYWFYNRLAGNIEKKAPRFANVIGWIQWILFALALAVLVIVYPPVMFLVGAAGISGAAWKERKR